MKNLLIGLTLTFIGQILIFFQTNGQFFIPWFKNHPFIISLIGFGVGMISFSFLTWAYLGEGITTKTTISLMLALTLVLIQILWK